jgi:DNA-directed RNA polymerase II subunit RPB3
VESIGNLEPDAIIQQGIKVLQQKLATVIQDLVSEGDGQANGINGGYDAPRSPDVGMNGQPWQEQGYTTPYANGAASAWGGAGAATPYGATQNGTAGWS